MQQSSDLHRVGIMYVLLIMYVYVDIEVLNFLYICILDIYCAYIRYTADAAMTTFAFDPIKSNPSIATNLETLQTHAVV